MNNFCEILNGRFPQKVFPVEGFSICNLIDGKFLRALQSMSTMRYTPKIAMILPFNEMDFGAKIKPGNTDKPTSGPGAYKIHRGN